MCLDSGRRIEENRMKRILSLLLALALTLGLTKVLPKSRTFSFDP